MATTQVTNAAGNEVRPLIGSNAAPSKPMSSAGAVAQSVVTKFAIIGINAATGIITARALLPVGRGELAAMILWPVFLANTLTLGFPSALTFEMKSNPKKSSELLGTALLLAVLTSAIAIALGVLFMHSWIPQYSLKAILYAQILLATTPLTSLLNVGRGAFLARGDFGVVNGLLACSPALTLSLLIALLLTHSLTPYSGALAYAPVGVVPVGWMMWRLWRLFRPSLKSFRSSARSLFSYGIRSYGVDLCGTMALYVDQVVVVRFLMPDMMGIYVVALSLSRMLNVFHTSVVMVLFPKAVSESAETVRAMTGRAMRMSTLLTASTGLGIALVGAPPAGTPVRPRVSKRGVGIAHPGDGSGSSGGDPGAGPGVHGARTAGSGDGSSGDGSAAGRATDARSGSSLWNRWRGNRTSSFDDYSISLRTCELSFISEDPRTRPFAQSR